MVPVAAAVAVAAAVGFCVIVVAAAIFSRLFVFAMTGLFGWGESISASLFTGELGAVSPLLALSYPACESADGRRAESACRNPAIAGALPLAERVCDMLFRDATEEIEACRVVREAGAAGGPMDVRWAGTEVRVRAPAEATLAFEGVPVLETEALDAALRGLVGDLVGDCALDVSTEHSIRESGMTVEYPYRRTREPPNTSRSGSSDRTWAGCVEALPSAQGGIVSDRGTVRRRIDKAAGTGGLLDSWLGRRRGLRDNGCHHGLDKHAVAHRAIEIALSLNAAIVFARLVLELDPYPLADLEACLASKPHGGFAAIV